ncbi:MAG TPA: FtsX-like permease family protein [Syntrophorhabdaceae bacterium]|nr:FtsX-like permease family protein [Syntrophorhabdaceae bacterium]HOL06262.1 FtsX-like permease family protein [Syntrophorhabdaceae bacterium]HPP42772.1 FtsX-like permease family protein [Syntrophorhabdaceae bacterium]
MLIPFSYNIRNLIKRKVTTTLTVSGMALVVFVFATIMMMSEGIKKTLVQTGSYDNAVFLRKGSNAEVMSSVTHEQASIIETDPEVAYDADGKPLVARELNVLIILPKKVDNSPSNVTVRGIGEKSPALRPQVRLIKGRMPNPGTHEVAVGISVSKRFQNADIGGNMSFGARQWHVVGIFDGGNTAFSSEVWGDNEQLKQAFKRPVYSSVIFKMKDSTRFNLLKDRIEKDPRFNLEVKRETRYYEEQSEIMARFLNILGVSVTIIFSIGAIIGAMITMYAQVANRVQEIGTMRALGFRRGGILISFLVESLMLGLAGGLIGLFFASFLTFYSISTLNFQTFSELAFSFSITPKIVFMAILFSLVMGFVGGVLPAMKASRIGIIEALRAG